MFAMDKYFVNTFNKLDFKLTEIASSDVCLGSSKFACMLLFVLNIPVGFPPLEAISSAALTSLHVNIEHIELYFPCHFKSSQTACCNK